MGACLVSNVIFRFATRAVPCSRLSTCRNVFVTTPCNSQGFAKLPPLSLPICSAHAQATLMAPFPLPPIYYKNSGVQKLICICYVTLPFCIIES